MSHSINPNFIKKFNSKVNDLKENKLALLSFISQVGLRLKKDPTLIDWLKENKYYDTWIDSIKIEKKSKIKFISFDDYFNYSIDNKTYKHAIVSIDEYISLRYNNINPKHLLLIKSLYSINELLIRYHIDYIEITDFDNNY